MAGDLQEIVSEFQLPDRGDPSEHGKNGKRAVGSDGGKVRARGYRMPDPV
jgi:hypothetical protein